jgi:hypothetical protein
MAMKSLPDKCLRCDGPWTDAQPHGYRGLHRRCYMRMRDAGRLDEFPILRYRLPTRPPVVKEEVACLTPDCGNTVVRWSNRINKTYRCSRCQYLKTTTGGYDRRLLPRYDSTLPPKERVAYWLDPDHQQQFRGVPTPFVKPGGPEGDCLIWQRQLKGNPQQMETGNTYPTVHWYNRQERAHRVVYSVLNDIPLEELLVVDHSCEIKQCINPAHLGAETLASNTAGRIRTMRHDRLWNDPEALRARLAELEQQETR